MVRGLAISDFLSLQPLLPIQIKGMKGSHYGGTIISCLFGHPGIVFRKDHPLWNARPCAPQAEYLLSETYAVGKSKAKYFQAIAYNKKNSNKLREALYYDSQVV